MSLYEFFHTFKSSLNSPARTEMVYKTTNEDYASKTAHSYLNVFVQTQDHKHSVKVDGLYDSLERLSKIHETKKHYDTPAKGGGARKKKVKELS